MELFTRKKEIGRGEWEGKEKEEKKKKMKSELLSAEGKRIWKEEMGMEKKEESRYIM